MNTFIRVAAICLSLCAANAQIQVATRDYVDVNAVAIVGSVLTGPLTWSGTTYAAITLNSLTTVERDALTPVEGMMVYNSDTLAINAYQGGAWVAFGSGGGGGGSGTVTAVAMTVPSIFSIAGSPVTTSGTFAVSLATQAANIVFAGPTSGGAATPTFRAIVDADVPAAITRDTEWDTFAEINAATTDTDAVLDTDIGTTVQGYHENLQLLTSFGITDDRLPYYIDSGNAGLTYFPSFGRTLVGNETAGDARTDLGLVIGTDVQAYSATLAAIVAGTWTGASSITTLGTISTGTWSATDVAVAAGGTGASTAEDARTNLGLVIGTDVQAYNANALLRRIQLEVTRAKLGTSLFPTLDRTQTVFDRLTFDGSTDWSCSWQFFIPADYNDSVVPTVTIVWTSAGTANDVTWDVSVVAVTDGTEAAQSASYGTVNSSTVAVPGTSGHTKTTTVTLTNRDSIAAGDLVGIDLNRDASADSNNDNAHVLSVVFNYSI